MKNIAVLYDIENLVGGYNLKYLSEISLRNILLELSKGDMSNIAIQKAYADWSNNKFNKIKWDIAELGIEPIQMYGFAKGNMKNAADIQLVIDAMEILHSKPFIDTFVIVSGDGGFSSLVKKISEHGKKVIGCAYKKSANAIFTKICDEFIFIDNTLTNEQLSIINEISMDENQKKQIIEHPILKKVLPGFKPLDFYDLDTIDVTVKKLMKKLSKNMEANSLLKNQGLNISVLKSAFNYLFVDFDIRRFGFLKLSDFIRYVLNDSGFKLVLKEPSDYRIVARDTNLPGFDDIECLPEKPYIHSVDNYVQVLKSGKPVVLIPDNICGFYKIADFMIEKRTDYQHRHYEDIVMDLLHLNTEEGFVHKVLSLLINCDVLKGDNSSLNQKEQNYYFSIASEDELLDHIYEKAEKKILATIDGSIDDANLKKIMDTFVRNC